MQSPLLMENATKLLSELARIQTKHYERDPKCKRRYVCGLKQVMKHIRGKSLKYLIVARKVDEMVEYFHTVLAEALVNHVCIYVKCYFKLGSNNICIKSTPIIESCW